jgi:hypothetical protein
VTCDCVFYFDAVKWLELLLINFIHWTSHNYSKLIVKYMSEKFIKIWCFTLTVIICQPLHDCVSSFHWPLCDTFRHLIRSSINFRGKLEYHIIRDDASSSKTVYLWMEILLEFHDDFLTVLYLNMKFVRYNML